ncbi:SBBP repeat-containing protein [Emticicia sp. BO119]|uniref:SBBP repeat-containing protein n=1 Tax=Emticicia sp. BO119 TaxID=2757768 RepID=UPI0015EFF84B|nr:SBBP repeat-containing protein [Emticicia sp. BO119]MBA4852842.1 SBBP repeat-containing protein [Emticicia sp. BO119]
MKKLITSFLLVLITQAVSAQTLSWVRKLTAGTNKNVYDAGVATDGQGNTYVAGNFRGDVDFGGTTISNAFGASFVAKYNASGGLQWVKTMTISSNLNSISAKRLCLDVSGNVMVVGTFSGTVNFSGTSVTATYNLSIFLIKFDNQGIVQWIKQEGGSTGQYHLPTSVTTDNAGNIYMCGYFNSTITFSGTTLNAIGNRDGFFAKYNSAGNMQWAKQFGGSGTNDDAYSITTDGSTYVFVTGDFQKTTSFDATDLTASGGTGHWDAFIAKYAITDGALQWVKPITATSNTTTFSIPNDIKADASGNTYITGSFTSQVNFGGTILTAVGLNALFVATYNNAGTLQWVKQAGAPDGNHLVNSYGVAIDASKNVYIAVSMYGTMNFDGTTVVPVNSAGDMLVAKYSNTGVFQWEKHTASTVSGNQSTSKGIDADASGNIYVIGLFQKDVDFFGTTLTSTATSLVFDEFILVLKQNNCPLSLSPTATVSSNQKASVSVSTTGTNTIPNASNVIYQGGNYVQLNVGFSAENGSVFTAVIAGNCQ